MNKFYFLPTFISEKVSKKPLLSTLSYSGILGSEHYLSARLDTVQAEIRTGDLQNRSHKLYRLSSLVRHEVVIINTQNRRI
jgi:hypothetical protein